MFEMAQIPLHTPAIPSLWDEVLQLILSILELESTHKGYGTLLLLKLVVMIVVFHGIFEATFYRNIESNVSVL